MMRKAKAIIGIAATALVLTAGAESGQFNDGIDRADPNFVKASILLTSPGDTLYSCAGHLCYRLECPKFNLDYCFSYESEPVANRVLTFFAGKLKMGMFAIPTADFLKIYEDEGRGVHQYALNLPADMKVRLWKILDDKVAEGALLPYDYIRRGCAWSVLSNLRFALNEYHFEYPPWPKKFDNSRREIIADGLWPYIWTRLALHAIVGFEGDITHATIEKLVMPMDLIEFLQLTKINGETVLACEPQVLLPYPPPANPPMITPIMVALSLVALAIGSFFIHKPYVDWLFLALLLAMGIPLAYLWMFSSLPATGWNWLIVPFNPLPVIFWRWRRYWALPFALVVVAWLVFMLCYPHRLTDPAYLVIALAYVVIWVKAAMVRWGRITQLEYLLKGKCVTF